MSAIRYLSNFSKSMAYTAVDVVKDMNPAFTSFAETNQEVAQISYRSIRDFKATARSSAKTINDNEYTDYVKKGFKNAWSDLKTGSWYNKERIERAEAAAIDEWDDSNPFTFDDEDDDDISFDGSDNSSFESDQFLADSMDEVGMRTSSAISTAILRSAELQTQANADMHKKSSINSRVMYGGIRSDLGAMNLNLANLVKFNTDIMHTHVQNSTDFYTNQTALMTETRDILKEMLELQKSAMPKKGSGKSNSSGNMRASDIMDSNGMLDIASFGKYMIQKGNNATGGALDTITSMKEMGMLDSIIASPMQFVMRGAMEKMIAPTLKKSFEDLNKSIGGMFSTAMIKATGLRGDTNPIKNFIGNLLGIDETVVKGYNVGNYNKEVTTWTGKDHKALTEVIPTLLSSINANLGGEDKRFDYAKGKFVSVKQIKKEYDNLHRNAAMSAGMEIYYDHLNPQISNMEWKSKADEELFREQIMKVLETNFRETTTFEPGRNASAYGINIGSEKENEALMKKIEEMFAKVSKPAMLQYSNNLINGMQQFNDMMEELGESGDAVYNALLNDSEGLVSSRSTNNSLAAAAAPRGGKRTYNLKTKISSTHSSSTLNTNWDEVVLDDAKSKHPEYFNTDGTLKDGYELKDGKVQKTTILEKMGVKNPLKGAGFEETITYVEKPVTDFVNMITQGIYNVFFPKESEDSDEEGMSFAQKIAYGISNYMSESSAKTHDYMDEYLGNLKEYFKLKVEQFKDKHSDLINGFSGGFKEGFKNLGGYVKNSFRGVGNWLGVTEDPTGEETAAINSIMDIIDSKATGGRILFDGTPIYSFATGRKKDRKGIRENKKAKKAKLAVISEGEKVVTPDNNTVDGINDRMEGEHAFLEQILTGEECDDIVYGNAWDYFMSTKDDSKLDQLVKKNKYFTAWIKSDKQKVQILRSIQNKKNRSKFILGGKIKSEAKNALYTGKNIATDLMDEVKDAVVFDKDKEAFDKQVTSVMDEIKQNYPNFVTGGALGAGVSLLTGAIGGPLLGAAAGAGIGLLTSSEKVQEYVFGKKMKDGSREGGMIPAEVSNLITKYAPNMAKGATVGAITSLMPFIPGGPVAGIVIGSSIGFATKNEGLQKALFGEDFDLDKFQEKVQKVLPKMGLGAIAGLVAGPFGVATNAILGASLGFASDTDAFKNAIFGEEKMNEDGTVTREGGVYGAIKEMVKPATNFINEQVTKSKKWLKDKVTTPIERLISPLGVQIKQMFKSITNTFTGLAKGIFQKFMDHMSGTKTGKFVGGLAKGALNIAKAPLSMVGGLATFAGDSLRRHQLRVGTAYQVKGLETAEARLRERDNIGSGALSKFDKRYSSLDEVLERMDPEQVQQLLEAQKAVNEGDKYIDKTRTSQRNKINMALKSHNLNKVSKRLKVKIRDLAAEGNYAEAIEIIQSLDLDDKTKEKLLNDVETASRKISDLKDPNKLVKDSSKTIKDFLTSQGLYGKIDSKILQAILESEYKANKDTEQLYQEEEKEKIPEDIRDNTSKIVEILTEIRDKRNGVTNAPDSTEMGSTIGYIATSDGKLLQTKTDKKGNTVINNGHADTAQVLKEQEEEEEERNSLLKSMKDSMFGLFDRFKRKDAEEEESKKNGKGGLLGTLWELFTGSSTTTKVVAGGAVALLATGIADKLGLTDKLEQAENWILEEGIPKFIDFFTEKVMPKVIDGFGGLATLITNGAELVFGKMLPALIPAIITSLPDIAGSIIRGIAKLPSAIADAIDGKKDGQNYYDVATVGSSGISSTLPSFGNNPSSINKTVNGVTMNYTVGSQWSNSNLSLASSNYTDDGLTGTTTGSSSETPSAISSLSNALSSTTGKLTGSVVTGSSIKSNDSLAATSTIDRDAVLPKAFQASNSNDAVYEKVTASYDSIANNIINVNGTQMTINDLLNSDEIVGYVSNSETGEQIAVHGYEVLKYPSLAAQFGIDTYLSDEEMSEQQKRMGIESSEEKLVKRAALTSVEAVLNPRQARRISNVLGKVGDGLNGFGNLLTKSKGAQAISKIPILKNVGWVTKPVGYTSKLFGGAANAGSTYINALGSVQDRLAGVSRDFSDVLPDEIGLFDDVVEEGAETATQSRGGLRGFIDKFRKTDVVDTGLEFADEVSDSSLADKVFNSRIGNKVDDITGGALTRANDFIVDNRVKISNGINDIKGAVSTKVDDVTGALSTKVDDIAGSMSSKLASSADSNILVKWAGKAQAGIVEFFSNSKIVKKFSDAASELGEKFSKEALQEAAEKIAKKLAEFLIEHGMKKLGAAIAKINIAAATAMISQIATAIYGFFSGYNNANTIMGVTEMPNVGVRCICGVIQALNEAFCFGIIPLDIVFDCIWGLLKLVFPSLENCDLEKERQAAQEELAKYNLEHGTDLSLDEYNDRDKIGTQIKNAIFGIEKVNEDGTTYREGGVVNSIKNGASDLINNIKESETWANISNTVSNITDTVSNAKDKAISYATGGAFDDDVVREKLGLNDDVQVTLTDRLSVYAGNITQNLFGTDMTKQINGAITIVQDSLKNMPGAINNKLGDLFGFTDEEGNPVSLTDGVSSTLTNIKNGVVSGATELWNNAKDTASELASNVKSGIQSARDYVTENLQAAGDYVNTKVGGFFGFTDENGNAVSFTEGVTTAAQTLWGNIQSTASDLATNVQSGIQSVRDYVTGNIQAAGDFINKKIGGIFGFTDEEGNPIGFTDGVADVAGNLKTTVGNTLSGISNGVKSVWGTLSDKFSEFGDKIKDSISGGLEYLDKKIGSFFGLTDDDGNPIGFTEAAKDKFESVTSSLGDLSSSLADASDAAVASRNAGSGSKLLAAMGSGISNSGFVSQKDPKYASRSFNRSGDTQKQTIGDTGCAPASAAMVLNQYGAASGGSILDRTSRNAMKYKLKNDGVTPDYFADEFAQNGLSSQYISGNNKDTIKAAAYSNTPVVLMGQDATNKSKKNSPFGPNNHYVVTNGMSNDGKTMYINDPEAKSGHIAYPTSKILNSTKIAVAPYSAGSGSRLSSKMRSALRKFAGGRGTYGEDTPQYKVWTRLRGAGYSEYAVAGVMGNIQHESGFDPSIIERGSGAGFGLCQWTGGRRDQLNAFAAARNASANDIELQIDFLLAELDPNASDPNVSYQLMSSSKYNMSPDQWLNATDITTATQVFCRCFERPQENCAMDKRIAAAQEYYQAFTGTPGVLGTGQYSAPTTSSDGSSTTGSSSSSGGTFLTKLLSGIDTIASMFGLTGSSDSSSSSSSYSSSTGGTTSSGSVEFNDVDTSSIGGNVSPNPEYAAKQRALVAAMKTVEGKLHYTQQADKRNPDIGSGDCSSTVAWAYKKVLGVDPGASTHYQREDSDTYTVTTDLKDESKLQLGDLLLRDGHVEMYSGPGQMIGHGGPNWNDLGPTTKKLGVTSNGKQYNLVRRWIGFQNPGKAPSATGIGNNTLSAMGSGLETSSGLTNPLTPSSVSSYRQSSPSTSTTAVTKVSTSNTASGSINADSLKALLQAVLQIVQNTSYTQEIVTLLTKLITLTGASSGSSDNGVYASEIANIKTTLAKTLSDNAKQNDSTSLDSLISMVENLAIE